MSDFDIERDSGILELEDIVRQRAAGEWNVHPSCVFLNYSKPEDHGNEFWNVSVNLNHGPETDTIAESWAYDNASYLAGLQALAGRAKVTEP